MIEIPLLIKPLTQIGTNTKSCPLVDCLLSNSARLLPSPPNEVNERRRIKGETAIGGGKRREGLEQRAPLSLSLCMIRNSEASLQLENSTA